MPLPIIDPTIRLTPFSSVIFLFRRTVPELELLRSDGTEDWLVVPIVAFAEIEITSSVLNNAWRSTTGSTPTEEVIPIKN